MLRFICVLAAIICSIFCVAQTAVAGAAIPSQGNVCSAIPGPGQTTQVVKSKLLGFVIAQNPDAVARTFANLEHWQDIFEDEHFCADTVDCRGMSKDACSAALLTCSNTQHFVVGVTEKTLEAIKDDSASHEPGFRMNAALAGISSTAARMRAYLDTPGNDGIVCLAPKTPKVPQSPAAADTSPLRVRGVSDDLMIRRDQSNFSSTSKATLTVSGDHSTNQTQTVKATGAVGYAFSSDSGFATAIPYVSFYQSLSQVTGKAESLDPTSFVAAGMVFLATARSDLLEQTFSGKPQFLENTKDHSQIASFTFLYKPYTAFDVSKGGFNLNDPRPLPFWPNAYGEVLFDLRANVGEYTNRGNDPVQRLLNQSYSRAGSHFGFAVTTNSDGPSFTLTVAETYLYGFSGTVRNLDLFESTLTYNFDPKHYLGVTATYNKGRNLDTGLREQVWLVGLSARY
jgi:hypothetical protein